MARAVRHPRHLDRRLLLAVGGAFALAPGAARAASASKLTSEGRAALNALYARSSKAKELGARAKAVLVFPNITKAGFIVGGQGGQGVLFAGGQARSFHRITAASIGYQIGAQKFGYALFFITDKAVEELRSRDGWSIGTGPSFVLVDEGFAKTLNTTTLQKAVYAMSFDQRGLMAGAGLEGSKVTQITPDP